MATIQQKTSRGHKYWYIVESRRVNGKPRPVVLEYLGKPEDLLERLRHLESGGTIKSYAHGTVAALLRVARELDIPQTINQHVRATRKNAAPKPLRHGLTVGATLLLGAVGRVCMPASKQGWWPWAKTTTCEYLLSAALSKLDSQHFWDLMDALPVEAIEKIEQEIVARARERYGFSSDTVFYDTTNFFTFIATQNDRCAIAQRGKNKQKRGDLRQVGLALVVTREDKVPLFHLTYQGNQSDCNVFKDLVARIRRRLADMGLDLEKHTLVFDRGNNSKANMALLEQAGLHYVGALTPCQHKQLIAQAQGQGEPVDVAGKTFEVFRTKALVWGCERTLLVFGSEGLKTGQARGIHTALEKAQKALTLLRQSIQTPARRVRTRNDIEARIAKIVDKQFIRNLVTWELDEPEPGRWLLTFRIERGRLADIEHSLGLRILMTDRHDWESAAIIQAFHGQANVENAFKNIKNPYHLALRPQFHWTDQKIAVHYFICVMGYLMSAILLRQARQKAGFTGTMDTLLDTLDGIRLAARMGPAGKKGRRKIAYQLEEMDEMQQRLMNALDIGQEHIRRIKMQGLSVYNQNTCK